MRGDATLGQGADANGAKRHGCKLVSRGSVGAWAGHVNDAVARTAVT